MHGYTGTSRDSPRSSQVLGGHADLGQSQVIPGTWRIYRPGTWVHGYTETSRDSPRSSQVHGGHTDMGLGSMGIVGPVGTVPGHPRYLEDI